jgi:hypothetical protein
LSSLPYNLRVNVNVPFPALVAGANGIKVSKSNGIWTIAADYTAFAQATSVPDATNAYTLVWNAVSGQFTLVQVGALQNLKAVKILDGTTGLSSPYTALPTDEVLIVKQASGAPFTVNVDWLSRTRPLRVVDGKGDASTNNITITPAAGQTQLAEVNYSYVIDGNGGSITLTPLPDGSGAY